MSGNLNTGHCGQVSHSAHAMRLTFTTAAIQDLSFRSAKPLYGAPLAPDVSVVSCAITGIAAQDIAIPAEHTKNWLTEAPTTESPSAAALNGSGFRPCDTKPKQE